ncbi:phage terminase small subunit P27 family [Lactobacillus sp. ESL0225]|uniref:phage terminase small subunit P27 family n=1 Tax=Lactobacillus sp. ESL0225 TaxID=2069351 RepID=UPI001F15AF65|nr:phage terminase small subunit P27 family [Lactobacillus sp. ESL0225]
MRKTKLTTDKNAPSRQRKKTEKMLEKTVGLDTLPTTPPNYLKSYARAMWQKIVPFLNSTKVVKTPDRAMVEALCINYQVLRESYDAINENGIQTEIIKSVQNSSGEIIAHDKQGFKPNPALKSIDSASVKINSLGSQLGLSPSARAQLTALDVDDDATNVADILGGGDNDF